MRVSLFGRLFAKPPEPEAGDEAEADGKDWYDRARREHGPSWGVVTVPASKTAVFFVAGAARVLRRITITAYAANAGTCYIGGMGTTTTNGTPLSATSSPLVLQDVLLGDLQMLGTSAGDSVSWVGS